MLLVRATAWADVMSEPGTSVALLRHAGLYVLFPAIFLGVLGSALLASGWLGAAFPGTVLVMPLVLPLLTMLALVSGYAKGRSRAWLAPLFEIGGISMLTALLIGGMVLTVGAVREVSITIAFVAALLCLLFFGAGLMIWRDIPSRLHLPLLDTAQKAALRTGQVDFTLIALATFLTQVGSFLLAAPFLSEADLGLLRAAERLALLVSFPVLAINPLIMPRIVRLSRGGDDAGLRRVVVRAVLLSGGIGAPVLLGLLIWPERALALMGAEFGAAAGYLRLMALIQFAAALGGPLAVLLNMSGRERASMWINVGTLVLAAALVPGLSLVFGATGFASAYAAIIFARNLLIVSTVIHFQISRENSHGSRLR